MPKSTNDSFQNLEVNFASLSDTIFFGTPCNLPTSQMNTCATSLAENVEFTGMKYATFVNLCTITMMESCCLIVLDNPVMKSMEMTSHFHSRRLYQSTWMLTFFLHKLTIKIPSHELCYIPLHIRPIIKSLHIFTIF